MTKAAELAKMGEVLTNSQLGGRRNVIINGAMQLFQRDTSQGGIGASAGYFSADRIRFKPNSTSGRLTSSQDSSAPSGFGNSMKLACTTADTSIAAGEYFFISQKIEGQDLQQFAKGTSDAKPFTVSFYVKGNASATYTCELFDEDNTRQISKTFSVTTNWTRVELLFPADTTGAFDDDNASSMTFAIWLHAGSNYTSGTLNSSSWASSTTANRVSSSNTSFFDSTDRTFFITGIQLETSAAVTPFEHRSLGEELRLCQRYYELLYASLSTTYGSTGTYSQRQSHQMKVTKRALPTITDTDNVYTTQQITVTWEAPNNQSVPNIEFIWSVIADASSGEFGRYDRKLKLDAELS